MTGLTMINQVLSPKLLGNSFSYWQENRQIILDILNKAALEVVDKTDCLNAPSILNSEIGKRKYALSDFDVTGHIKITRITYDGIPLDVVGKKKMDLLDEDWESADNGTPTKVILEETGYIIFNCPCKEVKEIKIDATREPIEFTEDTEPNFPEKYHPLIVKLTQSRISGNKDVYWQFERDKDDKKVDTALQEEFAGGELRMQLEFIPSQHL